MRARRPLLLRGVLRFDSLRAIARVSTLAALDLAGLVLAIYTALLLKSAAVNPDQLGQMWGQTKEYAPLAGLVMLLLFARSGLYRDRAQRPGDCRQRGWQPGQLSRTPRNRPRPRRRACPGARAARGSGNLGANS